MPRRAHDTSDSEASAGDRSAAAVSGSRPSKRRRITSRVPRSLVDVIQAGDQGGSPVHADEIDDTIETDSSSDDDADTDSGEAFDADNDSDNGNAFDDGDNESEDELDCAGGKEQSVARLTIREARFQVIAYLRSTELGAYDDVAYTCNLCPTKGKSHLLPGILDHLASQHGIARPNVKNEYEPVQRRLFAKFRYECRLCHLRKRHFGLGGIKKHLARVHDFEYENAYKVHATDTFGNPDAATAPTASRACGASVSGAVTVKDEPSDPVIEIKPSRPPIPAKLSDKASAGKIASEAAIQIALCDELRGVNSVATYKFVCRRCERVRGSSRQYDLFGVVQHLMFALAKEDHGVPRPQFRDDYDLATSTNQSTMQRSECPLCTTQERVYTRADLRKHLLNEHHAHLKTDAVYIRKNDKTPKVKMED